MIAAPLHGAGRAGARRARPCRRPLCLILGASAGAVLVAGCASVTQMATSTLQTAGVITSEQAVSINRSAEAVEKTFRDITPEQEYYIGRSVAATVLATYPAFDRKAANEYLNTLGQSLAMASDRPETFSGYRFLLIDSADINAFAAPGGLILVSRGLARCCRSEDALAAVLAHEIGHVQGQHGLRAIRKGRLTSALTILSVEAGKNLAGEQLGQVTRAFEGSITDISTTLMNSGYARSLEADADEAAVALMRRVGYDPRALVDMLEQMRSHLKPGGIDFAKTHPSPDDRIASVRKLIGSTPPPPAAPAERQKRFDLALRGI